MAFEVAGRLWSYGVGFATSLVGTASGLISKDPARTDTATSIAMDSADALRSHIDGMEKKQKHLARLVEQCNLAAMVRDEAGDKLGAFAELKQRKVHEAEISKLRTMISLAEANVAALDDSAMTAQHLEVMKRGVAAIKAVHAAGVSVSSVSTLHDELEEALAEHDEINIRLHEGIALPGIDDTTDAELDAMLSGLKSKQSKADLDRPETESEELEAMLAELGSASRAADQSFASATPAAIPQARPLVSNTTRGMANELLALEALAS